MPLLLLLFLLDNWYKKEKCLIKPISKLDYNQIKSNLWSYKIAKSNLVLKISSYIRCGYNFRR